jgi:CxxC motif-containing protein
MIKKELICIVCPKGCHLKIDENLKVTGNGCARGIKYGIDELTNPTRMLTSTVVILNGEISRLPVVTSNPIPKDKIMAVMKEINQVKVEAPIYVKDIIIPNVLGLGVDLIATRDIKRKEL